MSKPKAMLFNMKDANWEMTPEFGGGEHVFYRSADKTRVVVAFRESGKHTFTYPFDEFAFVLKGIACPHIALIAVESIKSASTAKACLPAALIFSTVASAFASVRA